MDYSTADADSDADLNPPPTTDPNDALPDPEDDTCNEEDGCGACGGDDQNETADEDLPVAEGGVA